MTINKEFTDRLLNILDASPNRVVGTKYTKSVLNLFNKYPLADIKDSLNKLPADKYTYHLYEDFEHDRISGFGVRDDSRNPS
ncbi:hypothetical protein FD41_GL000115 [Lentilactobacillus farraginis DSM 18382 = JCM 14108]|uniref:Uncharacterized protein n=1 Tax=Lentilactobacillus farraginis DSM 18382 = JCM 14108 TaxID=1423743 RepID=X0PBY8_9LACO|nr:hypothetical protein FD41_GL000115 [Lentilactobacillus farraginis DSM 18382 = JCM 14108]GAF37618.1 hypothetical protein JCM14108_2673 [Lentilactobacillus farraginis DSM 18382 = JCM 14108]